jgi:hypothetical protein
MAEALAPGRLLATLAENGVDFVLIGGFAVGVHGHIRATKDVDVIVPSGDEPNRDRLAAALHALDARRFQPEDVDVVEDPEYPTLMFHTRFGRLDVLYRPDGADHYRNVRKRAVLARLGGAEIPVVSLDDLIRMKLAAGRAGDINDVVVLTAGERGGDGPSVVEARYPLLPTADPTTAAEYLRSRVEELDVRADVWADDDALHLRASRTDLTQRQLVQWATAVGDRLRGAGLATDEAPTISVG